MGSHYIEYETLVETAVDATITIDKVGKIKRFNPASEKLFQYAKEEVIGQNIKILMPTRISDNHDGYLSAFLKTGVKNIIGTGREVIGRRKNGVEFPLELSVGQMGWEQGGYVGILRDISERKLFEHQISDHVKKLARSNEDLAQFAYIASHDLKAPLRGIANLAGWIDDKVGQHMDEECASYMKLLRGRIDRLDSLLFNLLKYSRIGQEESTVESVDLNKLVQGVIDLQETKNFSISVDNLPTVQASSTEMTILFQNLIGNAMKHHDQPKGNIQITGIKTPDHFELAVHDDGPGIQPNMTDKVFSIFQTLKPRDELEGSGMGLAFVKKIIERNNASISIEKSNFDRGAAFIIQWPI
ncbi:MAG: PAS domain S-box protein [Sneathiella sp.]|nr:PAS domain S-box protein [Sneathiella sp.]